jgi:mannose-6-phosphate isomerase-like protein (cupin superfamily)
MADEDFLRGHWEGTPYPELIRRLPLAALPLAGARGWLMQGEGQQLVFFDLPAGATIPPHSHGEQWGLMIEGEMDLTVAGLTRRVKPGDWYHIPAGAAHTATFLTRVLVMDLFADRDRYRSQDAGA